MSTNKKSALPGVSDSELQVLKLLWSAGPSTPNGLQELFLGEGVEWAYTTVQTLLHRLHKKDLVSRRREGVAQIYSASVDREELLAAQMTDLAERMCEGAATPLLLSLVRSKKLSKKDLDRFREIIDEEASGRAKRPKRRK